MYINKIFLMCTKQKCQINGLSLQFLVFYSPFLFVLHFRTPCRTAHRHYKPSNCSSAFASFEHLVKVNSVIQSQRLSLQHFWHSWPRTSLHLLLLQQVGISYFVSYQSYQKIQFELFIVGAQCIFGEHLTSVENFFDFSTFFL